MGAQLLDESSKRIETLLARFDAFPPATGARPDAEELLRVIAGLYGAGLERITQTLIDELGEQHAGEVLEKACEDPLLSSLIVTHGLHPVPLELRVRRAIDGVRPYLQSHQGDVEIVGVTEDAVEVRLHGTCDGCASSQATLKDAIERAVFTAAPEVLEVRAVGKAEPFVNLLPVVL